MTVNAKQKDIDFPALEKFLRNDSNVIFALIFGSYGAGRKSDKSDLDLAIYFEDPPAGMALFKIRNSLSDICGRDIDLVVLNNSSPLLMHQVMKNRLPLIIKDPLRYRMFRERVIRAYDEYKFISGKSVYDR